MEWAKQHHIQSIFEAFLGGEWKPLVPLPTKSDDMAIPGPPPPVLSLLAWGTGKAKETLKTPDKVVKAWCDHSQFGSEFKEFLENARKEFDLDVKVAPGSDDNTEQPATANKRRRNNDGSATATGSAPRPASPSAALKVIGDASAAAELPALCWESKITAVPQVSIKITVGQGVYLVNSGQDTVVKCGTIFAGFYKGKFFIAGSSDGEANETTDHRFSLQSHQDMVFLNSKFLSLGEIVASKRLLTPSDATIGYHTLEDATSESPQGFNLTCKTECFFRVMDFPAKVKKEEQDDASAKLLIPSAHLGGTLPPAVWNKSDAVKVLWAVKWPAVSAKGLQPIRPMIAAIKDIPIGANQCVELIKSDMAD